MPVLLFDIDGTLVRLGGAGKAAMETALRDLYGVTTVYDVVPYAGRTDPAIAHDLLVAHNIDPTPANATALTEAYLDRLPTLMGAIPGHVCAGVNELLARLDTHPGNSLGLLTGNVRRGAGVKLTHYGLWDRFRFGGFGDGCVCRNDVARSAVKSAVEHLGRGVEPADVWVIGDTPADVTCARAVGAKVVAVATGWHPLDELHATGADIVVESLADVGKLPGEWFP